MRKLLISIIILILTFSLNTVYAAAGDFIDMNGDPGNEAVQLLSGYGIINGYPDDTFKPDNPVTRAEMAKIAIISTGLYEYSKNMTSVYEDMDGHWAESYVELARALNIVKGTSSNIYGPDNYIRFDEAITIIIRLLGYTDDSLVGRWPTDYYEKAKELNLFDNITNHAEYASRRDVSMLFYNALSCDLVQIKENTVYKTGKTLLSKIGRKETKVISLNDLKINDGFDYTDYLFNKWDVYYNLNGDAVHMTNPRFNEFSGTVTSLLSNKVIFVTDSSGNVRAFQLTNIPIVFNGALGNFNSLENSKIKVVYEDDSYNGNVIGVIGTKVTDKKLVGKNDLYVPNNRTFAGKYLPLSGSQVNYGKVYISGAAVSLEEIKENDMVYFYDTDETGSRKSILSLHVVRNHIQGTVTNVEENKNTVYYTVNGQSYKTGENYVFTEKAAVNDTVKLILDDNDNIVKLYITRYGKEPSTYGIVLSSTSGKDAPATAKIMDAYGNVKTYSLAGNSGVVTYIDAASHEEYITSLNRNDIVKFDPVNQGSLKIIKKLNSKFISNNYNEYTQTLSSGNKVSSGTFIVYEYNGKYSLLKPSQLDSYLVGKVYLNAYGGVDVLYLTRGLKPAETNGSSTLPEPPQSYSGTSYDIIKSFKKIDDSNTQIEFFNTAGVFYVANSSAAGKNLPYALNSYVRATIKDGTVTGLDRVSPETDKIRISAVYSDQLQIDGITYMEYSSTVRVYVCTLNSLGNITSVRIGTRNDLQTGARAQLYDIYGPFDGIIDVIILFN